MKKCQFFSKVTGENGKPTVKMQNGFTDGEFNYYSDRRGHWYCIDPKTGMSIATGSTKEKAQQNAKNVAEKFEKVQVNERYKKMCNEFDRMRANFVEVAQ